MSSATAGVAADKADRAFLGHPKGLGFISFTEAWERFSYYGMQTLLVLYMVHQLLLPGHLENVAGFTAFKAFLESLNQRPRPLRPRSPAQAPTLCICSGRPLRLPPGKRPIAHSTCARSARECAPLTRPSTSAGTDSAASSTCSAST